MSALKYQVEHNQTSLGASLRCSQCSALETKYRCPRCFLRTCSLECCKKHKVENDCSGKRDRTSFTAIKDFTDATLSSDYVFLEEALRLKNNVKRQRPPAPKDELPHYLSSLVREAAKRSVELLIQAPGMARRRCNTTKIDWKKKLFLWRIEWIFRGLEISCVDTRFVLNGN
mmetsp:Transcript_451/g.973  ORF Transcript_451/g.973 Transcript_451/m.973 type:complete len:172 (-) Transcript_451:576-1091(-)